MSLVNERTSDEALVKHGLQGLPPPPPPFLEDLRAARGRLMSHMLFNLLMNMFGSWMDDLFMFFFKVRLGSLSDSGVVLHLSCSACVHEMY